MLSKLMCTKVTQQMIGGVLVTHFEFENPNPKGPIETHHISSSDNMLTLPWKVGQTYENNLSES